MDPPNPYNKISINFLNCRILYFGIVMITNMQCQNNEFDKCSPRVTFRSMKRLIFKCIGINSNFKLAVLRKSFYTFFLHFIRRLERIFRSYCELSRNENLLFFPFHEPMDITCYASVSSTKRSFYS